MSAAVNLPTFHLDGAFQTASGLYRLHAGQLPGRDFFPYLGVGPLYLLWPVFEAFGASLGASVIAAKLVTLLCGATVISLLMHWTRPAGALWRQSLVWGSSGFMLTVSLYGALAVGVPYWMEFYTTAGNSLRPIRSIAPYLTVGTAYALLLRSGGLPSYRYVVTGVVAGLATLWSNDYALLSVLSLGGYFLVAEGYRRRLSLKSVMLVFGSAVLVWWFVALMLTGGHYDRLLAYNLRDVLHDQWWYFAPYSEEYRVFSVADLTRLLAPDLYRGLLGLGLSLYLLIRFRTPEYLALVFVSGALIGGGIVASVGGHIDSHGYFRPASLLSKWLFLFLALRLVAVSLARHSGSFARRYPAIRHIARVRQQAGTTRFIILAIILALSTNVIAGFISKVHKAQGDPERFFVPELGGYLKNDWHPYVEFAREHRNATVIEEYWGLWSAINRVFPPWPVDSSIHALGSIRAQAAAKVDHADFVITTRFETSPPWQPWNFSINYWLYQPLIDSFDAVTKSPNTLVWRRGKNRSLRSRVSCKIGEDRRTFTPDGGEGVYEMTLDYSFEGGRRSIILVRNNISFGIDSPGYMSLDPMARQVKFPLYKSTAGSYWFDIKKFGAGEDVAVEACTAQRIDEVDPDILRGSGIGNVWRWDGCELPSVIGRYSEVGCTVESIGRGHSGTVVFGPYVILRSGRYQFRIRYDAADSHESVLGDWDVFLPFAKAVNTLNSGLVFGTRGDSAEISGYFVIDELNQFSPVEVRIFAKKMARIRVSTLTIERVNPL